jgi:hypothetical protein
MRTMDGKRDVLLAAQMSVQRCILLRGTRAQYNNSVVDAMRSPNVREVGSTDAQFNPTVVHFIKLCARYLTLGVYQIVETA